MGNDVVLRVTAEKGTSVDQVVNDVQGQFKRMAGAAADSLKQLESFGERARAAGDRLAVGFAAAAAAAGAMARELVSKASEMEQFRARLETLEHSTASARETMQQLVQYSASTPFEIRNLVASAVQLEALGQNARKLIPVVTELASGMGQPAEEAAAAVGLAFSGVEAGVRRLRQSFGLSTFDLKKFGAAVGSQGEVFLHTTDQLRRFREAFLQWEQSRFGGAVERQMNTLKGAVSNLADAGSRTTAALGQTLLPMLTTLAKGASTAVGILEGMPAPMKEFVAYGTLATAVGAGLAATVLLLGGRVASTVKALNEFAKGILASQEAARLAARAAVTSGGLFSPASTAAAATSGSALVQVMRNLTSAARAWVATPIGATLAGALVVFGAAKAYLSSLEESQRKWGEQVEQDAHRVHTLGGALTDYLKILRDLDAQKRHTRPGGGVPGDLPRDIVGWMQDTLKSASPSQLAAALHRNGVNSLDDLNKLLEKPRAAAKETRDRFDALTRLAEGYGKAFERDAERWAPPGENPASAKPSDSSRIDLGEATRQAGLDETTAERIKQQFAGRTTITVRELRDAIHAAGAEVVRLAVPTEVFDKKSQEALDKWTSIGDLVNKQRTDTKEFFEFLGKEGTSGAAVQKAKTLEAQSKQLQASIKLAGLKTDNASLEGYLKSDAFSGDQKELLGRVLELRGEARKSYEEARKLDAEETQHKVEGLRKQLALRQAAGEATVEDARRVEEQIGQIREAHSWNTLVGKKEVDDRKAALELQLATSKGYLERLKSQNLLSASQEAEGYARILERLQNFRKTVLPQLLKKDPEAAAALLALVVSETKEVSVKQGEAAKAARLHQLNDLKHLNDKFLEDQRARFTLSTARELEIVRANRKRLEDLGQANTGESLGANPEEAAMRFAERQAEIQRKVAAIEANPHLSDQERAKRISELTARKAQLAEYYTTVRGYMLEEASLAKKLHEEELARLQERNNTRLAFLGSELEALKEQQAAGKRVNDDMILNLRQQLALRLDNIRAAAQKELEVEGLTQQQITDIHERANVQRLQALRAQRAALKQILDDQEGGLRDIQSKVGTIKQLAEGQKEAPGTFETWGKSAFGAQDAEAQKQHDAGTIDRLLRQSAGPGFDRNSLDALRSALSRQGIELTGDESLNRQRTASGGTYATIEQLRREYGLGSKESAQQIADEVGKLDKQIADLEKAISSGLQSEISRLSDSISTLASAVGGRPSHPGPKAGAARAAEQPPVSARPSVPGATGRNVEQPSGFDWAKQGVGGFDWAQQGTAAFDWATRNDWSKSHPAPWAGVDQPTGAPLPAGYTTSVGPFSPDAGLPSGFAVPDGPGDLAPATSGGDSTVIHATNFITMGGGLAPPPVRDAVTALNEELAKVQASPNRWGQLGVV
jgi:hypothetical protein